jgi:hypothetical protein
MVWGQPARRTNLNQLDQDSGLDVGVSYTKQVLDAYKEYSKPHAHQIRNSTISLVAGLFLLGGGLLFGYNLATGDKSKTCDGVKQGAAVVLACISAAAGFVGASAIKL